MEHKSSMPRILLEAVVKMDKLISNRNNKLNRIDADFPGTKIRSKDYPIRKQRVEMVLRDFETEWVIALRNLDELCKRIRARQPHLNQLQGNVVNADMRYPDSISFGRIKLSSQNWYGYIPRLIPFPIKHALWLPDLPREHRYTHQLVLRLLQCLPIGSIELITVDPLRLGASLGPFLPLLNEKSIFPHQHIISRSDEIEELLGRLTSYIEDLVQNKFKSEIKEWSKYNSIQSTTHLKYKLLLLYGIPEQLTDKSLWFLGRLLEFGPKCGVLTILAINEERMSDRKYEALNKVISKYCKRADNIIPGEYIEQALSEIDVVEEEEFWPNDSNLRVFLDVLIDYYRNNSRFDRSITDLWDSDKFLQLNSSNDLTCPIGWAEDGKEIMFSIGGVNTEHHVLLAGRSGSGKSNLLHVLIHSLCHRYSPTELDIYLLDYKQGTEFYLYSSPPLPHARLVAVESDPEYGITVLTHLVGILEDRAKEFKKYAARDFHEYRDTSQTQIERILLIIDEFQVLFSEGRQIADPAEKMINQLLRQGRAFGIHVLLATQTLKGIQTMSMSQLVSQIGCRIALSCTEEDSSLILGSTNWEAATLKSPPEAILNNSNGAKSANQRFLIPFADKTICSNHIAEIRNKAQDQSINKDTVVFDGSRLPAIPEMSVYYSMGNDTIQLMIGEQLKFRNDPMSIVFLNKPSSNLLISGYSDVIHDGLFDSLMRSLRYSKAVDEVIYLNGRGIDPDCIAHNIYQSPIVPMRLCQSVTDLTLHELVGEKFTKRRVIIIDGLEYVKELHPPQLGFRPNKSETGHSIQDDFKQLIEEGPSKGTFVIAFLDNWRRCLNSCKDLFLHFEMRVGYCMNEDDAGSFLSGTIGKLRGLEADNRAVFINRLKNQIVWFRPYASGGKT